MFAFPCIPGEGALSLFLYCSLYSHRSNPTVPSRTFLLLDSVMNGSPDPLDSFPPLCVRKSDGGDSDSELERYCSANSMMGTPSTSMSLCSAVTLFHDFSDFDFVKGLENLSLGKGTAERSCSGGGDRRRSLRCGSSGLELYGVLIVLILQKKRK